MAAMLGILFILLLITFFSEQKIYDKFKLCPTPTVFIQIIYACTLFRSPCMRLEYNMRLFYGP